MNTDVIKISSIEESQRDLAKAASIIKNGGLVAFPTETVYGLGADATNPDAAAKIYAAKGRPSDNPLIIHICEPNEAERYTYTTALYYKIAEHFMPGPITVVMKSRSCIPGCTRGGLDTVAVRCPENKIARELIRLSGVPIAAPSANLSGSPSPTCAEHVIKDMLGRCDMIIDGGACSVGLESTIVRIDSDDTVTLLRPGKVTAADLRSLGINVLISHAVTEELGSDERVESPGMKYKHYAPKKPFYLLDGDIESCVEFIKSKQEKNIGIIAYSEDVEYLKNNVPNLVIYEFGAKDNCEEQAQRLFDLLRRADSEAIELLYAPLPVVEGIGLALYNRMIRAAAHNIIRL